MKQIQLQKRTLMSTGWELEKLRDSKILLDKQRKMNCRDYKIHSSRN